MNRLRDDSGTDSVSERGIEILRNVRPGPNTTDLKRKVWVSLQEARVSGGDAWRLPSLKVLALGAGVMAFAATAGAKIGGRWMASAASRDEAGSTAMAASSSAHAHHRGRAGVKRNLADADVAALLAERAQEPPAPSARPEEAPAATRHAPLRADHPPARPAAGPARAPIRTSQGRGEVLDALIALRQDHDADRAAALLDHYLQENRAGTLREEALALAIEAAGARGDRAGAARLARTYETEFPAGRFEPFVRSHLAE